MTKACIKCGEVKSLAEFYKHASTLDGLRPDCKTCFIETSKLWHAANPDKVKIAKAKWRAANTEYHKVASLLWKAANPKRKAENDTKWKKANPVKVAATSAAWKKANRAACTSAQNHRHARKLHATPAWASQSRIGCYYAVAAMLNCEGLQKYHVDHIVPLQGKTVCGLHIENNLQILTASENSCKGNKYSTM